MLYLLIILILLKTTSAIITNCRQLNVTYSTDIRIRYSDLLSNVNGSSWKSCLRECAHRYNVCKAVSFNRGTLACQIGLTTNLEVTSEGPYMSATVNENDFRFLGGSCATQVCGEGYRCLLLSSGNTMCDITECSNRPELPHQDYTSGGREVGSKLWYTCHAGYTMRGIRFYRTCRASGHWTGYPFFCSYDTCNVTAGYTLNSTLQICYKLYLESGGESYWSYRQACNQDGATLAQVTTPARLDFYYSIIPDGYWDGNNGVRVDGIGRSLYQHWWLYNGTSFGYVTKDDDIIDTMAYCINMHKDKKLHGQRCERHHWYICEMGWY